ncbi:hypothetical protein CN604_18825 [Bacillus wiedmannii]|nr:hypothetical protein CN604_18825 [Bacillus wiedmannii]
MIANLIATLIVRILVTLIAIKLFTLVAALIISLITTLVATLIHHTVDGLDNIQTFVKFKKFNFCTDLLPIKSVEEMK